eukprot:m.304281 g.304281  ORF g.304281 m.304281 type:complete len:489 (+) comp40846_c0_seq4:1434-2900(+)
MAEGLVSTVSRNASFSSLRGIVTLPSGFILAADQRKNCIWKVHPTNGTVSPFAGVPGTSGYQDGPADMALFDNPVGMAVHGSRVFVADYNRRIREVCEGVVSTVAGDGVKRVLDGDCLQASFYGPYGIAVKSDQRILTTDYSTVRLINVGGRVQTVAGLPGKSSNQDGPCNQATLNQPDQIAVGPEGSLYVVNTGNHSIRRIKDGQVQTFLDGLYYPTGIAVDYNGTVYVSDWSNKIYKLKIGGEKEVLCGTGKDESVDGQGGMASLNGPRHLHYDSKSSCLYFTERRAIRKVKVQRKPFSDPQVSLDLAKLVDSSDSVPTEAVFVVEEKQIKVHCKSILCIRSEYFNRLFLSGFKESQASSSSSFVPISIEDASYEAFHALITFLITGVIDVEKCHPIMQDILVLADRFLVTNLRKFCMEYLVKELTLETVLSHLSWSDQYGFENLKDACLNFAARNIQTLRMDAEFENLSKELSVELVRLAKLEVE